MIIQTTTASKATLRAGAIKELARLHGMLKMSHVVVSWERLTIFSSISESENGYSQRSAKITYHIGGNSEKEVVVELTAEKWLVIGENNDEAWTIKFVAITAKDFRCSYPVDFKTGDPIQSQELVVGRYPYRHITILS